LGSGIFCNGYEVSIVPRQDSQYTIARFAAKYQLFETSTIPPQLQQKAPLTLYEFETCPYCRKVREAVSILSLEVTFRPCPKNGIKWRREVKEKYGEKATFPFLMDPNTNCQIFESDDILQYLFTTYGNGDIPWTLSPGSAAVVLTEAAGLLFRGTSGGFAKPSNPPLQPLKVWSYEGSPFCKLVKEKLCTLELEHTQISCPRGSANRQKMFDQGGRFQVPYLEDPNTGVSLFESQAIIEYLEKQYSIARSPVKYL
jgi:glutathione S-transferase